MTAAAHRRRAGNTIILRSLTYNYARYRSSDTDFLIRARENLQPGQLAAS